MSHFIGVLLAFYTRKLNVAASLPAVYSQSTFDSRESSLLAGLWLGVICFVVHFIDLVCGFSLFLSRFNASHIVLHFCGCVLMCWFILEEWHYRSYWYIWTFFNLLPTILESIGIARVFCFKVAQY